MNNYSNIFNLHYNRRLIYSFAIPETSNEKESSYLSRLYQFALKINRGFGVPYEAHILSAHRTPEAAAAFARSARAEGYGVILCAAGMAAHLAGAFAANTTLPVVGIPMKGGAMDGLDALLATVQMPSGFPVATVALNGAKNAAYLAVAILAVADDELAAKLDSFRADTAAAIAKKDAAIAAEAAAL